MLARCMHVAIMLSISYGVDVSAVMVGGVSPLVCAADKHRMRTCMQSSHYSDLLMSEPRLLWFVVNVSIHVCMCVYVCMCQP